MLVQAIVTYFPKKSMSDHHCEHQAKTRNTRHAAGSLTIAATICSGTSKRRCLPTRILLYERLLHGSYIPPRPKGGLATARCALGEVRTRAWAQPGL
jgi:hypothetical protein